MALFSLWVLYILVVMLCIYHGSRVDWVLTRVGPIRLCLPALSMSYAHAKILLQNCYHKVALVVLLQNCKNADEAFLVADMCFQKGWQKTRWQWMLNRRVGWCLHTGWAKVLDGLSQQELYAVLAEVESKGRCGLVERVGRHL